MEKTPLLSQNSTLPTENNQNTVTAQVTNRWYDNFLVKNEIKIYKLTLNDFIFFENKEMWISSFLYCLMMDRIYTKKYLVIYPKSLRLSCTVMNILIPYFFLFHCRIIYRNILQNK
jgi:hypothetical protein